MNSSPTLRVQINQIDHTLCPSGPLDNSPLPLAPVIRIYGPSSTGSKTCVHVHQVYPYFFVEYTGKLNPRHGELIRNRLTNVLTRCLASETLYRQIDTLPEPCYCHVLEAQPKVTQVPIHPSHPSGQGRPLLRLQLLLFSLPQGSSRGPIICCACCRHITVRLSHEHVFPYIRKPLELYLAISR